PLLWLGAAYPTGHPYSGGDRRTRGKTCRSAGRTTAKGSGSPVRGTQTEAREMKEIITNPQDLIGVTIENVHLEGNVLCLVFKDSFVKFEVETITPDSFEHPWYEAPLLVSLGIITKEELADFAIQHHEARLK